MNRVKATGIDHADRYLATLQIFKEWVITKLGDFLEADYVAETVLWVGIILVLVVAAIALTHTIN